MQKIWIESPQLQRTGKFGRVGNHLTGKGEARKQAHGARPQAIGGLQAQSGRLACAGFKLPDLIVDVIRAGQAKIRCQSECQWVARAEGPITHEYSIRGFGPPVKGFVLKSFSYEEL